MPKYWYCIGTGEVGSYTSAEGITDFNRGIFLVYGDCCLTTGFKSRKDAEKWLKEHPCAKHGEVKCEFCGADAEFKTAIQQYGQIFFCEKCKDKAQEKRLREAPELASFTEKLR